MVSYTRARAEALGVECKVGIADRAVRVVSSPRGWSPARASLTYFETTVYVLAGLWVVTVGTDLARAGRATRSRHRITTSTYYLSKNGTNGHGPHHGPARRQEDQVRVAIIGVGNCASSFVQGVHYYRDADPAEPVPGLMHVDLGGYHVPDIEFSAAFDIDAEKVGKDLSEAIFAGQNNTLKFGDDMLPARRAGPARDDPRRPGQVPQERITKAGADGRHRPDPQGHEDRRRRLLPPVGSEQATNWYVEQILEAGCAFVNCIPVFIAREDYWNDRFKKAGLPIIGDDIKSQVGATICTARSRASSPTAA